MALKKANQLCKIKEEILRQNPIFESEQTRVHTVTTDNSEETIVSTDLRENFSGALISFSTRWRFA